ncbi:DUF924 family protein [Arvimicrobium flavum]|uniref:DUF924 family protein n=1 Tax=Arvimicrobium flavum TaxID=3393320 RepID=UPI00237C40E7|nr:DUF924 family protein [Mesorhizobium shangrilense]
MHPQPDPRALECAQFWLDLGLEGWFKKSDAFDAEFRERFLDLHFSAARRELDGWSEHADGSFALMVLLDQFPRNSFRGSGHMYATDPLARYFARKAIAAGHDKDIDASARVFFYLPFSHSEDIEDQKSAVELNRGIDPEFLKHAVQHRDIVARFGRFPHRNAILGRETTPDEQAFLEAGGFAG